MLFKVVITHRVLVSKLHTSFYGLAKSHEIACRQALKFAKKNYSEPEIVSVEVVDRDGLSFGAKHP